MSLNEDGTITTQDNDLYQDEMIEDLFSTDNFSEVDTCVEIMGTTRGSTSLTSRRSLSYASSQSKLSKKGERRSAGSKTDYNTLGDNTLTTSPGARMQPIDEDIHDMVREDVRRMIAKIRSAKQPRKPAGQQEEEEKTDKMIVNPGKYGEVDPRSPSAQARKMMIQKMKKDKTKKKRPKSPKAQTTTRPIKITDGGQHPRETSPEQREGVVNKETAQDNRETRRSVDRPKQGYYKNKPEDGPEHFPSAQVEKGKETHPVKQPDQTKQPEQTVVSTASVASSKKTASRSGVSKSLRQQEKGVTSNVSVSSSKRSVDPGVASKSRSRLIEARVETKTENKNVVSSTPSKKQHGKIISETPSKSHRPASGEGDFPPSKGQQQQMAPVSPSVAPREHQRNPSEVSKKSQAKSVTSTVASNHDASKALRSSPRPSKGGGSTVASQAFSKGGGSTHLSKIESKRSTETVESKSIPKVDPDGSLTHCDSKTIASISTERGDPKTKPAEQEALEPEASELEALEPEALDALEMIERTLETIEKSQAGDSLAEPEASAKVLSEDDLELSLSEWKELHRPILSMAMTAGKEVAESDEIECVLAPFGELEAGPQVEPTHSIKPDPTGDDDENKQDDQRNQKQPQPQVQRSKGGAQENGGSQPGEKPEILDSEREGYGEDRSHQQDLPIANANDDISSLLALSNDVVSVKPLTVMSIKQVELTTTQGRRHRIREEGTPDQAGNESESKQNTTSSIIAAMQRDIGSSSAGTEDASGTGEDRTASAAGTTLTAEAPTDPSLNEPTEEGTSGDLTGGVETAETTGDETTGETSADDKDDTVELVLVDEALRLKQLEYENARLKDTLNFLQQTAVEKEKYFAELAWFGKRSEEEVQKWRPNFWRERLEDLGPELFEEFRADAMRIADPDVGDWEHGFSSGSLAMARLLLGLSHAVDDEKICAFHDPGQPCTKHCVTCSVAEQRKRELADFPVLDP